MINKYLDSPEVFKIDMDLRPYHDFSANVYVVRTPSQSLVIDCGLYSKRCREELIRALRQLELDPKNTSLFLTHFHPDHIGLVDEFENRNCPVYISEACYNCIRTFTSDEGLRRLASFYEQEGIPATSFIANVSDYTPRRSFPATLLHDRDTLTVGGVEFQCLLSPGHTPGQMVLYSPEYQLLFSGDHILPKSNPNISLWPQTPNPLKSYLDSLEMLSALPVRMVFPGHDDPFEDLNARARELQQHYANQLDELRQYWGPFHFEGLTAFEIAGKIFYSRTKKDWESQPEIIQTLVSWEILSLLTWLVNAGEITKKSDGSVMRYLYRPGKD